MASGRAAELAACFATRRTVTIAERDVEIRAFGLERMTQYAEFIQPAYEHPLKFLADAAAGGESFDRIIADATDAPKDWISRLGQYERTALILEIQEVNEPGFQQARHLATRLTESLIRMAGDGPTQSNTSSPTATPTLDNSPRPRRRASSAPSAAPSAAASAPSP